MEIGTTDDTDNTNGHGCGEGAAGLGQRSVGVLISLIRKGLCHPWFLFMSDFRLGILPQKSYLETTANQPRQELSGPQTVGSF